MPIYMTKLRSMSSAWPKGSVHSDKTKRLLSQLKKDVPKSAEHRAKIGEASSKPVIVDGVRYRNSGAACKALGVSQSTVGNRCRNINFPTWQFIDKE